MQEVEDVVKAAKQVENAFDLKPDEEITELPEVDATEIENTNLSTNFRELWERNPDENDAAWEGFKIFRDLGPKRRLKAVAEQVDSHLSTVGRWSSQFEWNQRVSAWDIAQDRIYQLRRVEAIKEMAERHGTIILEALDAMSIPFKALQKKLETNPNAIEELSEKDTIKLLDTASKMARNMPGLMAAERGARGMPTQIVEVTGEVTHAHDLRRDQIGDILSALRSAGAFTDGEFDGSGSSDNLEIVEAEIVELHTDDPAP